MKKNWKNLIPLLAPPIFSLAALVFLVLSFFDVNRNLNTYIGIFLMGISFIGMGLVRLWMPMQRKEESKKPAVFILVAGGLALLSGLIMIAIYFFG